MWYVNSMHLVMEYVTTYAAFVCVCETTMYLCGASCLRMPVHGIDRVCVLVCLQRSQEEVQKGWSSKPASNGGGFRSRL